MHIGRRLAYLRMKKGFSQEGVAAGVVSRGHYSNIEAGRYRAMNDILISLAEKMDVPANYLLQWESSNPILENFLKKLQSCLDNYQYKEAEKLIESIRKDFPFIHSLHQEIYFMLLESLFFIKIKNYTRAEKIIEDKLQFLTEEEDMLPECLKFLYYYVNGAWYFVSNSPDRSLDYFKQALEKADSKDKRARIYYNIALVLYETYERLKAINYAKLALEIFINDHKWLHVTYIYILLGLIYWENREYDEAETYLHKALDLVKLHGNSQLEGKVYHNLGLIYQSKKERAESIKYLLLSLDKKLADNCESILITYAVLAEVLISAGQTTRASEVIKAAQDYARNEDDYFMVKAIEAKVHFAKKNWTNYEQTMEHLISYYKKHKKWKEVKNLSEEYSEYLGNIFKYKDAFYYSKAALQAYRKLAEKGGE